MTIMGPVRTNGRFNIWGSPVFDGATAQVSNSIHYWVGPPTDNPNFVHGVTLGAPGVTFPGNAMLTYISSAAASNGLSLTGNSTIIFNSDATITVTNAARGWTSRNMPAPANGTVYVSGGSATVKGTVKGKLTVASDAEIYISGNIMYNTDPRTTPSSPDLLGLVAKNNVTVTAASAPTNLELDVVMVAITGSFQVDQYWVSGKGNMIQFGSLVNNFCGPTGVFDPNTGELTGGYNQLQYYDERLRTMIPPSFPPLTNSSGQIIYVKTWFREL